MFKLFITVCFGLILLLPFAKTAYSQTQPADIIVGTWLSSPNETVEWVFTDNSKVRIYVNGSFIQNYEYKISRDPTRCGVDMSVRLQKYPNEEILTFIDTALNSKKCYLVYSLTNKVLTVRPFGYATFMHFKKQAPPDILGIHDGRLEENDGHS